MLSTQRRDCSAAKTSRRLILYKRGRLAGLFLFYFTMRISALLFVFPCLTLIACSGGSRKIYHPNVGPFDENGDYVVALADAPVRKNVFAKGRSSSKPKRQLAQAKVPKRPAARVPQRAVQPTTQRSGPVLIARSPTGPPASPRPQASSPKPTPKIKPKPKASSRRHVVTRKDTLYGLSRRYGVSVNAIKKANGLRGSTIITGRTLKIPR